MVKVSRMGGVRKRFPMVLGLGLILLSSAMRAQAQDAGAAAAAAAPTPAPWVGPAITGPLSGPSPLVVGEEGPLKLSLNGIVSGMGLLQTNHLDVPGEKDSWAALSNGQLFIAKTDGWFQFYAQAGAYNLPSLATPFLATDKTVSDLYGPVPLGYLKLAPQSGPLKSTSIEIGALPTLIGAEYTFTFENMNVNRGLLWNQETAVSRGIQLNQGLGKHLSLAASWNDGFYSNVYNWISGSLTATAGHHALAFVAAANVGTTEHTSFATPLAQNNGSIYNVIYTFTKGPVIIQPYFQYTKVPKNLKLGFAKDTSTTGGAILASYAMKHGFSIAGRWEDIGSSGNSTDGSLNLIGDGPGEGGWSLTGTPTFQSGAFFLRADLAYVKDSATPAFGPGGKDDNQFRAIGEVGFILGKIGK